MRWTTAAVCPSHSNTQPAQFHPKSLTFSLPGASVHSLEDQYSVIQFVPSHLHPLHSLHSHMYYLLWDLKLQMWAQSCHVHMCCQQSHPPRKEPGQVPIPEAKCDQGVKCIGDTNWFFLSTYSSIPVALRFWNYLLLPTVSHILLYHISLSSQILQPTAHNPRSGISLHTVSYNLAGLAWHWCLRN